MPRRFRLLDGEPITKAADGLHRLMRTRPDVIHGRHEFVDGDRHETERERRRMEGGIDEEDPQYEDQPCCDDRMMASCDEFPKSRHAFRPMLAMTHVTRETGELDGTGFFGFLHRCREAGIFARNYLPEFARC